MIASNQNFNAVFGQWVFQIPFYQRPYVWGEDERERFLESMSYVSGLSSPSEYFMGTIIDQQQLTPSTSGIVYFDLVDGQQRLTTFVLFTKAYSLVKGKNLLNILDFDMHMLISGTNICKVKTNYIDQPHLNYIVEMTKPSYVDLDPSGVAVLSKSKPKNKNLPNIIQAYNHFYDEIKGDPGKYDFAKITNSVKFIRMQLSPAEDAQLYFNNINSLGVSLTSADLLKNKLFDKNPVGFGNYKATWLSKFEKDQATKSYWYGDVKSRISCNIEQLMYYYVLILAYTSSLSIADQSKYARKESVALHISECCSQIGKANGTVVNELMDYADIYGKIFPSDYNALSHGISTPISLDDQLRRVGFLISKLKANTIVPYLMYVVKNASAGDAMDIAEYLERYLIRRQLCSAVSTKAMNKFFTETLIGGNVITLSDLKSRLCVGVSSNSCAMPDDSEIQMNLCDSFSTNIVPTVILLFLEGKKESSAKATVILANPSDYTLEHMMPQTPNSAWPSWSVTDVYKIGNMTLLYGSSNSAFGNRSWNDKLNGFNSRGRILSYNTSCKGLEIMTEKGTAYDVMAKPTWESTDIDNRTVAIVNDILRYWPK